MKRSEWRRDVQKALIDKNVRISGMARDLQVTTAWIYRILSGDSVSPLKERWEKKISDYCGIAYEGSLEDEED